ncbi:MAG: 3'-phosphoadenosine 5'-phosphosulfate sulfotransferase [Caeruleum heppii]|nr:MAG: 3'-phosphoadenosine 5'-phosphosulfate sulfotransferase [Caeruleum heppii]
MTEAPLPHIVHQPSINGERDRDSGTDSDSASLRRLCADWHRRLDAFLNEDLADERLQTVQKQTRISLAVIKDALQRYDLPDIALSYNGGKDCLVLLILFLAALASLPNDHLLPPLIQSVYIIPPNAFPEIDAFVTTSSKTYHLDVERSTLPMKEAFARYLQERPKVKAIFVGTRRTDPHGEFLTHSDRTDGGWPDFMRVHPVIDWHYVEIWSFIRHFNIPYCPLYDRGYTSLGATTDTHPNPALRKNDAETTGTTEKDMFRPAYELVEDEEERLGRDW